MIKWVKGFLRYPYDQTDKEVAKKFDSAPSGVSEPVWSIVKTFKEKGRWKIDQCFNLFTVNMCRDRAKFKVTDTVTGEIFHIYSDSYYYHISHHKQIVVPSNIRYGAPSWMTDVEWDYICTTAQGYMDKISERFKVIEDRRRTKADKQAKVNQDKERKRLMNLYCGETK